MPDDLVDRLRDRAYGGKFCDTLSEQAADEIERLRACVTLSEFERHVLNVMVNSMDQLRTRPDYDDDALFAVETMSTAITQLLARLA